ncbi:MAG: SpoIIE family protein phosphatase [bacterium]|nr:MAG: SpoIIE family protein phosphatase [bacterium]
MFDKLKNPTVLRAGVLLLSIFLTTLAILNFYEFATGTIDENLFTNIQSRIMVTRPLFGSQDENTAAERGDLLLEINNEEVQSSKELSEKLKNIQLDSLVTLNLLRPHLNRTLRVSLPRKSLSESFVKLIPPAVRVIQIVPGGASDRAGMEVGDLIYRIDGQGFMHSFEADYIMRKARGDKLVVYEVLRQGEPLTLHVKLAIAGFRLTRIFPLFCGLIYLILGTLLFWFRFEYKAARLLGLASILVGYVISVSWNTAIIYISFQGGWRFLILCIALFLSLTLWFNSDLYFPVEIKDARKPHKRQRILNILTGVIIAITVLLSAAFYLHFWDDLNKFLQDKSTLGLVNLIFLYGIYSKIRMRKVTSPEYREMHRLIRNAGIFIGLFSILLAYLVFSLNLFDVGIMGISLLALPAAYVYTIGKYSLMDIRIRVRRNIQYLLASGLWTTLLIFLCGYLLLILSSKTDRFPHIRFSSNFVEVIDEDISEAESRSQDRLVFMVLSGSLLISVWYVGRTGKRFLRTKYDRFRYDYRLAAHQISEMFNSNLDMYDLARELAGKLAKLMHLKRTGVLFFREQAQCCCQEFYGFDGAAWTEYCLDAQHDIISAVLPFTSPVEIHKLSDNLRTEFEKQEFKHLVPIRSKERLVGLILVGEKLAESAFQRDDYEFLNTVAGQASVAIENAFLYEQLREQERLKQELKIARQIQMSSLPQKIPTVKGLDIYAVSKPATEVGGDFYDYLNSAQGELMVVVGDVSGKGTSAALYMSKIQGIFRSLHTFNLTPREIFIRANQILFADLEKKFFVTGLGIKFLSGEGKAIIARAGHLPLLYYNSAQAAVSLIQSGGIGFGLEDSEFFTSKLDESCLTYQPGDIFLLASDGITEAFNETLEEFGDERLIDALKKSVSLSAREICESIIQQVEDFRGDTAAHDDSTLAVIKVVA